MIINDYTSPQPSLKAAKIDFEIIFEDEDILLINKPKNLVVHPGVGNWDGTLVNGVINFLKIISVILIKFDQELSIDLIKIQVALF